MASGAVTHPIDLVKVRMQLYGSTLDGAQHAGSAGVAPKAPPGMMRTGYLVIKHEGVFGLYKGLSASLMRQASKRRAPSCASSRASITVALPRP